MLQEKLMHFNLDFCGALLEIQVSVLCILNGKPPIPHDLCILLKLYKQVLHLANGIPGAISQSDSEELPFH